MLPAGFDYKTTVRVIFLLGPAGSGKTFNCLGEIRAALAGAPEGPPLVFLAPKQATFQLERALLGSDELRGYTRLQILSFDRLAEFILDHFMPFPPRLLSEEGRVMVLRALLARTYSQLRLFRASARQPGFASHLSRVLSELQQHQVSPQRLFELSEQHSPVPQLADKLHDLGLLLGAYSDWLKENELRDPGGHLELAADALNQATGKLSFHLGGLWLDGFAEMTPQELDLLASLVPHCHRVTLAFCLEGTPSQKHEWDSMWGTISGVFQRCWNRLEKFQPMTTVLARDPARSRFRRPALAHLEQFWAVPQPFRAGASPAQEPLVSEFTSAVQLYQCANPEIEAVAAAREILNYIRKSKGRFRDTCVLVRSLEQYESVLRRVFNRYAIPFFLDRREPLSHHSLAELTRYALRTVLSGWEHDDWFGALKTGLVHSDQLELDHLENLALARGWRGNTWLHPFHLPNEPQMEQRLEPLRKKIVTPFQRFAETLGVHEGQLTGGALAAALRRLWDELEVAKTLQQWSEAAERPGPGNSVPPSAIHLQAWREMDQWLDNLELAFERTPVPLADWLTVVEAGLASLTAGVIPLALDEVLIGQVDRSRNPNVEVALVLGLNETVFPAPPASPPLLAEYDRQTLEAAGLALGPSQREQIGRERLLGYMACTRPRSRLVLTYSQHDLAGKPLNPSLFVNHAQRLFPGLAPQLVSGAFDWPQSLHSHELLVPLLRNHLQAPHARVQSLARLERLPVFQPLLARWEQIVASRAFEHLSPGQADKLYGPELRISISALEDYAACPFKFFVVRGLRAEERQQFEADSRERGSFQHEVLMEFHRRVQARGKRWRDLAPVEARQLIGQVGAELQDKFRNGLFASAPDRRFAARGLIENLQNVVEVLVRWAGQYLFEPQAVELSFGMEQGGLKPWRLELEGGRALLLRGRIDRIDLHRLPDGEAYAVVIDYKSSGQQLEQVKLVNGLDLQLMAYLGVLRDAEDAQKVLSASRLDPAGAFYVSLRSRGGSGKTRLDVLTEADAARREAYRHRGRFRADLLSLFDNTGESRGDQFRYSRRSDGLFSKLGNEALPEQEFAALLDRTENFLRQYGRKVFEGEVRAAPYRVKNETACDFCSYRPICRFDPWVEPFRVLKPGAS